MVKSVCRMKKLLLFGLAECRGRTVYQDVFVSPKLTLYPFLQRANVLCILIADGIMVPKRGLDSQIVGKRQVLHNLLPWDPHKSSVAEQESDVHRRVAKLELLEELIRQISHFNSFQMRVLQKLLQFLP